MTIVPVLAVDGEPSRELAADLLTLEIDESLEEMPTLRAHLLDGHDLHVGSAIQVSLGAIAHQRIVFDGQVTAIEFVFEENEPPMVVVSATGATPAREVPGTSLVLVRGNELTSAHVRVQKARAFVSVSGTTTGSPDIVIGSIVRLEHIGASFSGDGYSVTRVGHTFDLEQGLRSTFEARRPI